LPLNSSPLSLIISTPGDTGVLVKNGARKEFNYWKLESGQDVKYSGENISDDWTPRVSHSTNSWITTKNKNQVNAADLTISHSHWLILLA
jgi:hypothetical protein